MFETKEYLRGYTNKISYEIVSSSQNDIIAIEIIYFSHE